MNKPQSGFILSLLLLVSVSLCKAQDYRPGFAILKDGTRINGFIRLFEDDAAWMNQRFIFFKDSTNLANTDVKGKKYRADDLQSYQIGNTVYDKVHFVDSENLQLKSFGTNDHMLVRLAKGRINAHQFNPYPADVQAFLGTEEEFIEWQKQKRDERLRNFKILIAKDNDDKVKNAFDVDLPKYFEDTPEIFQKYQSGAYGNEPVAKKGLGAKLLSMAKKATFKPKEAEAMVMAFNDYNAKNEKK